MSLEIIILAAGQGTRMHSALPKVLHRIAHLPLLEHVYRLAESLAAQKTTVIYGHGGETVRQQLSHLNVDWIEQRERLGTGHAVLQMVDRIDSNATVLILYGDVPLLQKNTIEGLLRIAEKGALGVLTVALDDPTGYGRIVRNERGEVLRIVEEKDCTEADRLIREGNSGILAVNGGKLKVWLSRLTNHNAQREYYLTDIIGFAVQDGVPVETTGASGVDEVLGVNNREQLAHLERVYQMHQAKALLLQGVTLRDPARFDLRGDLAALGQDVEIDVNVLLEGSISLGSRVKIGPHVVIRNATIGDDTEIHAHSIIDGAEIGAGCRIGPFARLRPDTRLAEEVHVGNFVEIKKSEIETGSKINHLSYVGDASVGSRVNIGAGTITCNYDGVNKFRTIIEDGAFIGSDTQLVAPVRVGKNATIGAGSTVTKDAPDGQLTLSRSKQVSIEGWQRPKRKGE